MTPLRRARAGGLEAVLAFAVLGAAAGCGDPAASARAAPPAPGVVLDVDGLQITKEQIAAFDAYFDELDPSMGRRYRTRVLLDRYLLPLAIARRDLATERAAAERHAKGLADVAGNYLELREKGAIAGGTEPERGFGRNDLPFPVARWAFAPEHLLQASPPIETPEGFVVIATKDIIPGTTRVGDRALAFLVPFLTHSDTDFERWLGERKRALKGHVRYVAPELQDCLPHWLMP